jgi:hypothetical protein
VKPIRILTFVFVLLVLAATARFLFLPDGYLNQDSSEKKQIIASRIENEAIQKNTPAPLEESSAEVQSSPEIQALDEIFQSKNDNDQRMDQLLRNLSDPVKSAIRKKYSSLKPELRNERGTIVFLIGRELSEGRGSLEDVRFLKDVLLEQPCYNLADCSKTTTITPEDEHLQGINETTALYPQLMGLRYLKNALENGNLSPSLKAEVLAVLEAALHSPNPRVVQDAQLILQSYSKNH